ncbi:putative Microsomal glutathione S-transferase 2 [Hypsibius exemplaris]|uniref:Microsomal glutathione S-transferase 2 n=1 Tax=Hypsibius exemplaris TaxID=2072580 RepID=A0A1W0WZE0_HYPEX|nr:putative Microsomal glutathione S-transferase 2 [Hypsibius exemplaris]
MTALSAYLQVPAKSISVDSLWLVGVVSLASGFQLAGFARRVGEARKKYKVYPPRVDGDEGFVRCFRAQQNCLEFYPIFLVTTWLAAIFFHQLPAAVLAVFYILERESYFTSYSRDAEARRKPFYRTVYAIQGLALLAALGLFNVMVRQLCGRNLIQTIIDVITLPI